MNSWLVQCPGLTCGINLHTTVKNNSHFYLHRGPMDPKNYGIRYKRDARLKAILGCIISREVSTTYSEQVEGKCLTSYRIAETEIYPIEYMGIFYIGDICKCLFPITPRDKPFEFYGKWRLIAGSFLDLWHEKDGGVHWTLASIAGVSYIWY